MKTKLKKVISTCLAAVMLLSTMLGSSISVGAAVDNDGRYVPSDGVETNRYYFLMPDDWFNEYTSDAGIYWWDATDAPDSWEDMHKAQKGDCDNVFYVDCPKDVTVIIWTNMLSDGGEFAKMTVNIPLGNYDPDESPLYPDGLPSFDNMIYVCTNNTETLCEYVDPGITQKIYEGDWYFYYGDGKYGTTAEPTTPESTSSEFEYTILDDGTAEITGYTGDATELTIPSELDGKRVTSIGDYAYRNFTSLASITIPDSVTSIGDWVFEKCTSLTSITIPDSVTSIGDYAFYDCANLTSITIPDSVTSIGDYVLFGCTSLASITIPNTVTSIGNSAFRYCISLANITIPDSVTSIGDYVFCDCENLTSITIPDSVTSIGDYAFWGCTSLESITIPNGVTSIGVEAFEYCTSLTSVTIPDSVTSIGVEAFYDCSSLTSITIPDSVTSIGDDAFYNCTSLENITIPDSVTEIGAGAFYNTAWYVNQHDGVVYAGKVLYNYKGEMPENTTITVKDGTKDIRDFAFWDCTSLTSITLPNTITSIGEGVFGYCTSLASITIPDSVTEIGDSAFFACTNISGITIPNSVTSIGEGAFAGCESLASITIPASVEYIGNDAFGYSLDDNHTYVKIDGFKISGYSATEAERYANENGFEFISLGEVPTKDPDVLGDVNADGKVNIKDATTIQKSAASLVTLTDEQKKAADVNKDGKVNVNDVTAIQKFVAGIDTGFKIGE